MIAKELETLILEETRHDPRFDIGVRKHKPIGSDLSFQVAIYGNGFESSRNCNRDELIAMRDWINGALESGQ